MAGKLFSWVDIRDVIATYFDQKENLDKLNFLNFRIYWDGLYIMHSKSISADAIEKMLEEIFSLRYEKLQNEYFIILEGSQKLPVNIEEVGDEDIATVTFKPTLHQPSFIGKKEIKSFESRNSFIKPIIYAFHSFKGGVGRTLHALAMSLNLSDKNKVLLIDADFEAPGISWLVNAQVSFSDFLTLIHGNTDLSKTVDTVAENLKTESKENNNLFILPAFRSLDKSVPNLEIKPEHIYQFNNNPFILTDVIIKLAGKLQADYVIIDLRAGVSELSSGWFFDPRINKVFVTTLSSQSVLGTAMLFKLLAKFEQQNNLRYSFTPTPSLIISQVPNSSVAEIETNWSDTYSNSNTLTPLRTSYIESFINIEDYRNVYSELTDEQIFGKVLEPITLFTEELETLKSLPDNWESVAKLIKTSELDERMSKLAELIPFDNSSAMWDFKKLRTTLREKTKLLSFAESNTEDDQDFLHSVSITNLVNSFHSQLPVAVVVGAKGSGKTFLYNKLCLVKDWNNFGQKVIPSFNNSGVILPVTIPANFNATTSRIYNVIPNQLSNITQSAIHNVWSDFVKGDIEKSLSMDLTATEWREKWLDYIAWSAGYKTNEKNVWRDFLNLIRDKKLKVVSVFDGLEDLFKQFNNNPHQKKAIESLLQDVPNWLESQPERYLGIVVFVRRDIVSAAISQNTNQFLKKYEKYELKWNAEEALRLVHWVLNKYVVPDQPTFSDWKDHMGSGYSKDVLEKNLYMLWGMRMAKESTKEAFSSNWILESLANLKKEIQSRDIIRFLYYASSKTLDNKDNKIIELYTDRILFPAAIRDSIEKVGNDKIEEVKTENEPLKKVLEKIEDKQENLRFPCKPDDLNRFIDSGDIEILIENGVMVLYNGEYYMAELYRRGMSFEYSRKGRPKVLYS
jgi:MinD-like ATPase involved in chromosome partitioning or flagellar assembly